MLPSPTCASIPWRSRSVRASWRRHQTRSPNTITCSSPATAGERLGGDAAQQRQTVPATAYGLGDEALADQRSCERGLRVGQRLGVDARVDEHADVAQHDALGAGELGERLLVQLASGFERLELSQHPEQPPIGLLAATADRLEQLRQRRVGVERERLRRADLGHPGLHVGAGDPDEVWAVVDPEPVGVDLVHQVAGLARVEPLGDHRLVPDCEPDEHVEVLGALAARGGGQEPAVGDRSEPHLGERLVRLGRRVRVAQRLVGDQQVPRDRLQVGRVAVKHAVRGQHDTRPVAELAVEPPDLPGDLPVVGQDEQLDVRRQRWQPPAGSAAA